MKYSQAVFATFAACMGCAALVCAIPTVNRPRALQPFGNVHDIDQHPSSPSRSPVASGEPRPACDFSGQSLSNVDKASLAACSGGSGNGDDDDDNVNSGGRGTREVLVRRATGSDAQPQSGQWSEEPSSMGPRTSKRTSMACTFCRGRKMKCDGDSPQCSNCSRRGGECKYEPIKKKTS